MLNKFKDTLKNISKNGVTIPIKPMMLEQLMKRQADVKDLKVEITSEHLIIRGTTGENPEAQKNRIPFAATLKPIHMEKRVIVFEMIAMNPMDLKTTDIELFTKLPFGQASNQTVKVDFNSWDIVKKVPVGNIKNYEMVNGSINLTISL